MLSKSITTMRDKELDDVEVTLSHLRSLNSNWILASSTNNYNVYRLEQELSEAEAIKQVKDIRGLV